MSETNVKRSGSRSGLHIILKRPYARNLTHPALLYADADAVVYQVRSQRIYNHFQSLLVYLPVYLCNRAGLIIRDQRVRAKLD